MPHSLRSDGGHSVTLSTARRGRLGIGGQGQVFRALLAGRIVAVKLLRQPDQERLRALQLLEPSCTRWAALPQQLLYRCQPTGRGALAGYAMRLIDPATSVSAVRLFNFEEIGRLRRYSWQDAVVAAMRLAEAVAALHGHGVVIGDLNPENVVFEQGQNESEPAILRAVLLDADSFQIQAAAGQRHPCLVSRAPYTAPELIGCDFSRTWRQPASDAFSLAVLIHQLLLHDHPYDNAIHREEPDLVVTARIRRGLYPHAAVTTPGLQASPFRPAPREISEELDAAFRRSFCALPGLRPTAAEWALLLRRLHGEVVPCHSTPRHHHPHGRACLWCAVEQRLGQALCRFPPPNRQARIRERPAAPSPDPTSAATLLQAQLEAEQQQAGALLAHRAALAEQLLQLEAQLLALQRSHGSPAGWLDGDALQRRLGSLRHRLGRWLGRRGRTAQREDAVAALQELARTAAADVQRGVGELERQRQELLHGLARMEVDGLSGALLLQVDPATAVAEALQRAEAQQREQWLLEQLAAHTIRSWRVEGFGEGRLALLERHGLVRADQLHQHIERITALPGIGRGLQSNLRHRLSAVVSQLPQQPTPAGIGLVELRQQISDAPFPLTALQERLQSLQEQAQALGSAVDRLAEGVESCCRQRDRQLLNLEALL